MATPVERPSLRPAFTRFLRLWAWATASGILTGILVIGVGGRIAMRIMAVTSSDAVQGAFTDAGEEIGEFSVDGTLGLFIFGGVFFGVLGGWLYALIRPLLPDDRRRRVLLCGLVGAVFGTPILVSPGGRDFSILSPLWLAVLLFAAIPTIYGLLIPVVAERLRPFYETTPMRFPRILAFAPLLLTIPTGPLFLGGLLIGFVYALLAVRPRPLWLVPAGRGVLALALVVSTAVGVGEILDIDGRAPRPSDFVEPEFD